MSVSKQYLLEQIKRIKAINENKMILYKEYEAEDFEWNELYIKGHFHVLNKLALIIFFKSYKKSDLLNSLVKLEKKAQKQLDNEYSRHNKSKEIFNEEDEKDTMARGIIDECSNVRKVILNKKYYDKKSYIKINWSVLGFKKREEEQEYAFSDEEIWDYFNKEIYS